MPNPAQFSADEIFDLAVQTERNGRVFYEAAAAAATEEDVKSLLQKLGRAEAEHETVFRRLQQAARSAQPAPAAALPEGYEGEQAEYMLALLRSRVLPDEATALQVIAEMPDDGAAVDFALTFEQDTIRFMEQMREMIPAEERERITALLEQEHAHVRLLQALKDARA